jgi:hypothetical protein
MLINFTTLASGALAFTLALAWNDAAVKTIQSFFPPKSERTAARATLLYALVITILVIFIVAVINHTRRVVDALNHKAQNKAGGDPGKTNAEPPIVEALQGHGRVLRMRQAPGREAELKGPCARCRNTPAPIIRLWEPSDG